MAIKKFNSLKSSVHYLKKTGKAALFAGLLPFVSSSCSLWFPDYKIMPADGGVDRIEQRDGSREGGDNDSDVYDAGKDVYDGGADGYDAGDVYDSGDANVDGGSCVGEPPMTVCGQNRRGRLEYICNDGEYVPVSCNDPDECRDGNTSSGVCGLNGRGMEDLLCERGHYVSVPRTCVDPDDCVDGSRDMVACGLNSRGSQSRNCTEGRYVAGSCVDPDDCVDGTRMIIACGLNDRGMQSNVCVEGHYFEGSCRDPDTCVDGSIESANCGFNGRGTQSRMCTDGRYSAFTPCADPDECVDGRRETVACGLNDRGSLEQVCVEGHYSRDACTDPDECIDGSVDRLACGLNDRGAQSRTCIEGHYDAFGSCVDPDECIDGSMEVVACGLNSRGSQSRDCVDGRYVHGSCADPDECVDGSIDMAACGFNGRGSQERQCVDGQYEMFGPCERDPDECVSGAMDRVACGVDLGECFAGLESRLCAVDGMGNFVWQLQGDCDGRNPPLDGARGYREDMNADGVCSVPDLNGLDDDCNGIADDGYCMVIVPEGFFRMGCDSAARADCTGDNPVHNIILSRYSIDKHEVTTDQYRACVTAGSCDPPSSVGSFSRPSYYDNPAFGGYPVIFVNYAQAVAFCAAAGKRLPTEAEWEKAAKGTDDRRYPWGEAAPACELANYGFRLCRDPPDTTEVGSFPLGASPYGALDMAGNVIEWVHDWYDPFYYGMSPPMDPQGPAMGTQRVRRGGHFANNASSITVYLRSSLEPETSIVTLGFRCAKNER